MREKWLHIGRGREATLKPSWDLPVFCVHRAMSSEAGGRAGGSKPICWPQAHPHLLRGHHEDIYEWVRAWKGWCVVSWWGRREIPPTLGKVPFCSLTGSLGFQVPSHIFASRILPGTYQSWRVTAQQIAPHHLHHINTLSLLSMSESAVTFCQK